MPSSDLLKWVVLAILIGAALGAAVAVVGRLLGMPIAMVGGVTGGLVAAVLLQMRRRERGNRAG